MLLLLEKSSVVPCKHPVLLNVDLELVPATGTYIHASDHRMQANASEERRVTPEEAVDSIVRDGSPFSGLYPERALDADGRRYGEEAKAIEGSTPGISPSTALAVLTTLKRHQVRRENHKAIQEAMARVLLNDWQSGEQLVVDYAMQDPHEDWLREGQMKYALGRSAALAEAVARGLERRSLSSYVDPWLDLVDTFTLPIIRRLVEVHLAHLIHRTRRPRCHNVYTTAMYTLRRRLT
jgi:hypothetical protein